MQRMTARFETEYANRSPAEKAMLKRMFPFLGTTKATPLNVNACSSPDSDDDESLLVMGLSGSSPSDTMIPKRELERATSKLSSYNLQPLSFMDGDMIKTNLSASNSKDFLNGTDASGQGAHFKYLKNTYPFRLTDLSTEDGMRIIAATLSEYLITWLKNTDISTLLSADSFTINRDGPHDKLIRKASSKYTNLRGPATSASWGHLHP